MIDTVPSCWNEQLVLGIQIVNQNPISTLKLQWLHIPSLNRCPWARAAIFCLIALLSTLRTALRCSKKATWGAIVETSVCRLIYELATLLTYGQNFLHKFRSNLYLSEVDSSGDFGPSKFEPPWGWNPQEAWSPAMPWHFSPALRCTAAFELVNAVPIACWPISWKQNFLCK